MKIYDPKKTSKHISYIHMNNLYSWEMSRYLPYGGFKRLKNVDGFELNSISEKSPITYILEVDLDYLEEFYVLHNVYPLAPEKLAITYEILSDYCKNLQTSMEVGDVMK